MQQILESTEGFLKCIEPYKQDKFGKRICVNKYNICKY